MRRSHNSVLGVMLAVIIGLCLLPGGVKALTVDLNESPELESLGIYGNYATVYLDVTPGWANFLTTINFALLSPQIAYANIYVFSFNTTLTLNPLSHDYGGDFWFMSTADDYAWGGSGTYSVGDVSTSGGAGRFRISNPNITSEDQFGPFNAILFCLNADLAPFTAMVSGGPVPEPTTMLLLGSGLIGLIGLRRRFKK